MTFLGPKKGPRKRINYAQNHPKLLKRGYLKGTRFADPVIKLHNASLVPSLHLGQKKLVNWTINVLAITLFVPKIGPKNNHFGLKPPKTTKKRLFGKDDICRSNYKVTQCRSVAFITALLPKPLTSKTRVPAIIFFVSNKRSKNGHFSLKLPKATEKQLFGLRDQKLLVKGQKGVENCKITPWLG